MANEHRRPNLKDVAARAGTSIATASRVLNNTGYIADETRAKVTQAAEQLNYQPNLRAKGLRRGSSRTIGVLIPNLLNAYYTALANSISLLLTSNDYQMLLSSTRDDPQVETETLRTMIGHDVDGLIWVPTANGPNLVDYLQSQRTPTISIIRKLPGSGFDAVVFKDFQGSQAATRHLIRPGPPADWLYRRRYPPEQQPRPLARLPGRFTRRSNPDRRVVGAAGKRAKHLGRVGNQRAAVPSPTAYRTLRREQRDHDRGDEIAAPAPGAHPRPAFVDLLRRPGLVCLLHPIYFRHFNQP